MIFRVISGGEFLLNHIKRPDDGRCYFQVTAEGQPIKIQRTIFTECFYVIAMAELARASNLSRYKVRNPTLKKIGHRKMHSVVFLQGDVVYPFTGVYHSIGPITGHTTFLQGSNKDQFGVYRLRKFLCFHWLDQEVRVDFELTTKRSY